MKYLLLTLFISLLPSPARAAYFECYSTAGEDGVVEVPSDEDYVTVITVKDPAQFGIDAIEYANRLGVFSEANKAKKSNLVKEEEITVKEKVGAAKGEFSLTDKKGKIILSVAQVDREVLHDWWVGASCGGEDCRGRYRSITGKFIFLGKKVKNLIKADCGGD